MNRALLRSTHFLPSRTILSRPRYTSTAPKPKPGNPSFGAAKFSELGASHTVKVVVIIALCIGGTAESIFWTKVAWAKWGPSPKTEEGVE